MNKNRLRKVIVSLPGWENKTYKGYFHTWGQETGSHDRTMGNPGSLITIAIIEKEDGSITSELPSSIQFDDDFEKKIMKKLISQTDYTTPPSI